MYYLWPSLTWQKQKMFEKVAILLIRLCLDYAQQCAIKKLGTCCKQNIALGTPPFEIKSALRIPPLLRLICQIGQRATRQATNYCRGSWWNIEATHPMGLKKRKYWYKPPMAARGVATLEDVGNGNGHIPPGLLQRIDSDSVASFHL